MVVFISCSTAFIAYEFLQAQSYKSFVINYNNIKIDLNKEFSLRDVVKFMF